MRHRSHVWSVVLLIFVLMSCVNKESEKMQREHEQIREAIKNSVGKTEFYFPSTSTDVNFLLMKSPKFSVYMLQGKPIGKVSVIITNQNKEGKHIYVAGLAYLDATVTSEINKERKERIRKDMDKADLKKGDSVNLVCIFRDVLSDDGFGHYNILSQNRLFVMKEVFDGEMASQLPAALSFQDYVINNRKLPLN